MKLGARAWRKAALCFRPHCPPRATSACVVFAGALKEEVMFRRTAYLTCVVATVSLAAGFCSAAPVVFAGNGNTYDVIFDNEISHTEAADAATAAGGHLVSITSAAEQAFVESLLVSSGA